MPEFISRPEGLSAANGYSHVAIAGPLLFVSGQVPVLADGTVVGTGDVEAQVDQVFRNIACALTAADVTWSQVVKLTYFILDIADLATVRAVRDRYIDLTAPPASTLVQVSALVNPAFRVEIDAVAVRGTGG
ncbi:MAG TPA: RidA family protein [Propionicimonas sp.]|nr:RidA family protein [Propionicimonas sp.]